MPRETKFVLGLVAAWFFLALALATSRAFEEASAIGAGLTVWGLTALALLVMWVFQSARDWLAEVDVSWLIAPHLARFVGIYFLLLGSRGELPPGFARSAGIGDIVIAVVAAAMLLLRSLRRRKVLALWNVLGLIDIAFVTVAALYFGLTDWKSMAALREFPLMLLPTFFVPIIITSHVLIFFWLKNAGQLRTASPESPVASILRRW